jgi:hypothetical protein
LRADRQQIASHRASGDQSSLQVRRPAARISGYIRTSGLFPNFRKESVSTRIFVAVNPD